MLGWNSKVTWSQTLRDVLEHWRKRIKYSGQWVSQRVELSGKGPRQLRQAARVQGAEEPLDAAPATRLADLREDQLRLQLGADPLDVARGEVRAVVRVEDPRDTAHRRASELILSGPDPEVDGLSSWTLPELCRVIEERFNKRLHPAGLSRIVRRRGYSRQKARQRHPSSDRSAQEALQKGASPPP